MSMIIVTSIVAENGVVTVTKHIENQSMSLTTPDERVLHLLADGKSYTIGQIEHYAGGLPNDVVDAVARLTGSGKIDYYTNSKGAFYYSKL